LGKKLPQGTEVIQQSDAFKLKYMAEPEGLQRH